MPDDTNSDKKEAKGSLLEKLKKQPKWVWIAAALGGGALIIVYERMHSSTSSGVGSTTGAPVSDTSGLDTSSLDNGQLPFGYDYVNPGAGVTNTNSNNPTVPTSPSPTPTPSPTPGGSPTPTPTGTTGIPGVDFPLIPYGQLPPGTQYTLGNHITWNGQTYTIGPGSNGVLWGVAGNVPVSQWQQTPIGQGGKLKLYGPQSSYPNQPMGNGSGGMTGFNEGWNTATGHNDASYYAHLLTNYGIEALP